MDKVVGGPGAVQRQVSMLECVQYIDKVVDVPVVMQRQVPLQRGGLRRPWKDSTFFHVTLDSGQILYELPVSGSHSLKCTFVSLRLILEEYLRFFVKVVPKQFAHGNMDSISTSTSYGGLEWGLLFFSTHFAPFFGLRLIGL